MTLSINISAQTPYLAIREGYVLPYPISDCASAKDMVPYAIYPSVSALIKMLSTRPLTPSMEN